MKDCLNREICPVCSRGGEISPETIIAAANQMEASGDFGDAFLVRVFHPEVCREPVDTSDYESFDPNACLELTVVVFKFMREFRDCLQGLREPMPPAKRRWRAVEIEEVLTSLHRATNAVDIEVRRLLDVADPPPKTGEHGGAALHGEGQ